MMESENQEVQQLLLAGIAAVKRRELQQGQALLLQVVEKDDRQELAWLWLSVAMPGAADKEVALENALTLNPDNVTAQKRLARLRRRRASAAAPPGLAPEDYLTGAPVDAYDGLDDPYQCAYCGKLTTAADKTCPHCGQDLYERTPRAAISEFFKMALLLLGITAAIGAIQVIAPFLAFTAAQTADKSSLEFLLHVPGVVWFVGDFMSPALTVAVALRLMMAFGVRSGLLALWLLGLSQRWRPFYYTAFVLLVADVAWNAYLLIMGYLGGLGCLLNLLLTVVILTLLSASDREFAVIMERRWTRPDSKAHSAADFYRRGQNYGKLGLWALAVAQWRKAVGLAPRMVLYYKDLGIALARIGHLERSLRVLEEAQRQAPDDAQLPKLIQVVRELLAKSGPPPRRA